MVVKRIEKEIENKGPRREPQRDRMNLSAELAEIRGAIKTLPTTDEEQEMENSQSKPTEGAVADAAQTVKTKKNKGFKGGAKKKGAKKKSTVTKKAPAKTVTNGVDLATLCKEPGIKLAPRAARRILRNAKVKNPGRWSWAKASSELSKARKALKDAAAE